MTLVRAVLGDGDSVPMQWAARHRNPGQRACAPERSALGKLSARTVCLDAFR
jgi:hypothetical protein